MKLANAEHIVELVNETAYSVGSIDNTSKYQFSYSTSSGYHPSAVHGIRVYQEDVEVSSAIISGTGGSTGIHQKCYLLKGRQLYLCCGDSLFCLQVPTLTLNWQVRADDATCFSIYELGNDLLIHGELSISSINIDGVIKWQFSARDIFVNVEENENFKLLDGDIYVTDWEGYQYHLNKDGKPIGERPPKGPNA